MKRKIAYIVLAIIFIAAIIVTITCGLKVDLNYSEGENITFTVGKTITTDQIKQILALMYERKKKMTKKSIIISVISAICLVGIVSFAMYGCSSKGGNEKKEKTEKVEILQTTIKQLAADKHRAAR